MGLGEGKDLAVSMPMGERFERRGANGWCLG